MRRIYDKIIRKFYIVSVVLLAILMAGCGSEEEGFDEIPEEELCEAVEEPEVKGTSGDQTEDNIFIHVCGAVKNPGVYEMEAGSRIYEALELAGGMTEDAVENSMNQAEILNDGQQLYVMSEAEIEEDMIIAENETLEKGKVNINRASREELMTLPGIGESKADSIIRYREETGKFNSIEEIMEIEGIKEGVFRKIEDRITVS